MNVQIKNQTGSKLLLEIEIDLKGSMLEMEGQIRDALNKAGNLMSGKALETFDTNGEPIRVNQKRHTSKGREKKLMKPPMAK